jgi:hypothetical protein
MNISEAVQVVHSAVGLLILWALFYVCYRSYLLDKCRQALFEIRDDLFDLAAQGEIDFHEDCYRTLREDLNSLIFFADKMSFIRIAFTPIPENAAQRPEQWVQQVAALPHPLMRRALLGMREHALHEAMAYVVQRSLTLLFFTTVTRFAGLWIKAARSLFEKFSTFTQRVEAQALDEYRSAA